MEVFVENIQQIFININKQNAKSEFSLTKTCYGQAADVGVKVLTMSIIAQVINFRLITRFWGWASMLTDIFIPVLTGFDLG